MHRYILLTGSTGSLGAEILSLSLRASIPLVLLNRSGSPSLKDSELKVFLGDLTQPKLGLTEAGWNHLAGSISGIIHCAADTNFTQSLAGARLVNVEGTRALLSLAASAHALQDQPICFCHVSTAFVAGNASGIVSAHRAALPGTFRNAYEQSKAEAEALVTEAAAGIETLIVRPSIIVGRQLDGYTRRFNTVYVPLKLILKLQKDLLPCNPDVPLDMVPVDYVAEQILLLYERKKRGIYHIVAGSGRETTPAELFDIAKRTCSKLRYPCPDLKFICSKVPSALRPLLAYFQENPRFAHSPEVATAPDFCGYGEKIFEYCLLSDWGKKPSLSAWMN